MASLLERLVFLHKVPMLMRATSDDESPCPGYLFEEIGKISHESVGCCQCLLEQLLERLQVESCHVKLKVLKILLYVSAHGPPHFLTELRRNATFVQEAIAYSGPPDPVHGNALHQKVRSSARELAGVLLEDGLSLDSGGSPHRAGLQYGGMGSGSLRSGLQGFGFSPGRKESGAGTLLNKIQKAAEVVASAVLPPTEHPGIRLHDNHYHAVMAPSAAVEMAVPACSYNIHRHSRRTSHRCPGKAGGGWEETDSGHSSSHNSSQETVGVSQALLERSSRSGGSGSHSGGSRESGDLSERCQNTGDRVSSSPGDDVNGDDVYLVAIQPGDCGLEIALISRLTSGSTVFLSREESQLFIKECSTLNCEVVLELLSRKLQEQTQIVQMRALCALSCLMSSDFLSLDHIFMITHTRLAKLTEETAGPVANKATKLLRQFEALLGCVSNPRSDPTSLTSSNSSAPIDQLSSSSGELGTTPKPRLPSEESVFTEGNSPAPGTPVKREQGKGEDGNTDTSRLPDPSSRSLFSGMELVNRSKPVCLLEPVTADSQAREVTAGEPDFPLEKTCERPAGFPPVSAFSFLNL
ncbi:hypothetical protein DNTS_004332 [Danionella cerebrum]|uniref:Uncharacterized protein n=1 Tax=Danionella cerebrum TaxID=2873325 RepID=A0A553RCJ1_9TELE|nr:hypothetical protein DNTS_004332 [Danionella translucida]